MALAAVILFAVPASRAGEPPAPGAVAEPFFQIHPNHKSAGDDREIQAKAAELISRQAERDRTVPDGRARHFSWIRMRIKGWKGEILDQAALPSGLRIRVRVYPEVENGWCALNSYLDESYLIQDGVARLTMIEFDEPKGPRCLTIN
jgi:hypothetical protein